jgi:hypothetical protein
MKITETYTNEKAGAEIHLAKQSNGYCDVAVHLTGDEIFHGSAAQWIALVEVFRDFAQAANRFSALEVPHI